MLYPDEYVWFVFVSSMDLMLTWAILRKDGTEVNPIARWVIEVFGFPGAIIFKYGLMLFVIFVCEFVGRTGKDGRWLARLAVAISAFPVAYSLGLLTIHAWGIGL